MACISQRSERITVFMPLGVAADDKAGRPQIALSAKVQDARHDGIQVAGIFFPALRAVGPQVGPFVVKIER
jgi:hypothetical protein